ncbi:hypothetical protein TNCV_3358191 [Trichonephila clavipes]|nr:hypothetical protein TNCV_3358191 [Trichonephila clavipes]
MQIENYPYPSTWQWFKVRGMATTVLAVSMTRGLQASGGRKMVSAQTVRNVLHSAGLKTRTPRKKSYISEEDNPQLQEHMSAEAKRTSKLIMLNVIDATFKAEFFQKFSSWNKLKRVVLIA